MMQAAESEMGLVHTYMQSGWYRRAMSFAAHATGKTADTFKITNSS